jgi:TPR repeat protein
MNGLNWENEPDLDELRRLHALLARNPADAVPGLEALGERGSVASALYLADLYMMGDCSPYGDESKARYWYSRAHEKGCAQASYMLGRLYSKAHQHDLAFAAFAKGAEEGYAPAIYRLAKMYQRGEAAPQDLSQYRRLLELALSKRHIFAKRDLAWLLLSGRCGPTEIARGAVMLLSLWSDVAFLIGRAVTPGSTLDERVLA